MDNLTHSLVGALIGQGGLKRKTGLAMPALIIGANIPDIDAGCLFWVNGVEHLAIRRGITHGPIAMVLLPLLLAGGLWWFDRWQAKRGTRPEGRLSVDFVSLFALAFLATLSHPALDWLNVYGVRLLEPFSSRWFYGDTLFIIDVWLWLVMGAATWLSLRREKRGGAWRNPAWLGLVVTMLYIGANWTISRDFARMHSLELGSTAIAAPVPFDPRKRDLIFRGEDGRHHIIPGYRGPTAERVSVEKVGDAWWPSCRLDELARSDPQIAAFLFWSRVPLVERIDDGSLVLRDARFLDPRAVDRFTVALPDDACSQVFDQRAE
ncbi:hypothetical protein A6F68_01963 [Tsuneonella dongtanensis]|uniref:Inner membrane protein n=1 Tax=Tsuneonella dongtanensis TaxID=692370 RepID=A0A1B2AEE7_9SPHN|nr:metal-dependent hydrolase [Tsuneonella dongtanensis]ANY20471.1 hypothetical protein A6F68_01963 [Tsuneonella dongtanensis]